VGRRLEGSAGTRQTGSTAEHTWGHSLVDLQAGEGEPQHREGEDRGLLRREHRGRRHRPGDEQARAPDLPPAGDAHDEGEREEDEQHLVDHVAREEDHPGRHREEQQRDERARATDPAPGQRHHQEDTQAEEGGHQAHPDVVQAEERRGDQRRIEERRSVVVGRVVVPDSGPHERRDEPAVHAFVVVERGQPQVPEPRHHRNRDNQAGSDEPAPVRAGDGDARALGEARASGCQCLGRGRLRRVGVPRRDDLAPVRRRRRAPPAVDRASGHRPSVAVSGQPCGTS
jgi:hypothetical protein